MLSVKSLEDAHTVRNWIIRQYMTVTNDASLYRWINSHPTITSNSVREMITDMGEDRDKLFYLRDVLELLEKEIRCAETG